MTDTPEVRYARSGEVSIAYSVLGSGPFDVVFVSGWVLSTLADVARALVAGSGLRFAPRGVVELKGVPGEWQLHAVEQSTGPT